MIAAMLRRIAIGAVVSVLLLLSAWGVARWRWPATGIERYAVIDGDTLEWQGRHCFLSRLGIACLGQRLRLYGVDAFESKQICHDEKGETWPCGAVATARLRSLVADPAFRCSVDGEFRDRHAREFAVCTIGKQDVGAILVHEGLAFAYGRGRQYLPIENEAKEERRGAWAGQFVRPQYFREGSVK